MMRRRRSLLLPPATEENEIGEFGTDVYGESAMAWKYSNL